MTDSATRSGEHVCPECAERGVGTSYTRSDNLATHREKEHGVPRSNKRERKEQSAGGGPKLQRDLAKAQLGLSILVVTATNPGVLASTAAVDLLQKNADEWAATTYAVAKQDPRIMHTIESAMRAGVWAAFLAASAGSAITVAAMTGKVAVPYGAAVFLVPDLATMMQTAPPNAPPNGNGPPSPGA